jgi:esterase/lipase superfamily enzyme
MGAFRAANFVLRRADLFTAAIGLSGKEFSTRPDRPRGHDLRYGFVLAAKTPP